MSGEGQRGGMYEIRAEKQFNVVLNGIDCFYDISVLQNTLCVCEVKA